MEKGAQTEGEFDTKIRIRFFESTPAFNVYRALATLRDIKTASELDVSFESQGVQEFQVVFDGEYAKANGVKAFIEQQIRTSERSNFEGSNSLIFAEGLPLRAGEPESLQKDLIKYGAGKRMWKPTLIRWRK